MHYHCIRASRFLLMLAVVASNARADSIAQYLPVADNYILLIAAMSVLFLVLGMFLDPLGVMLISLPIILPVFESLNLDLVWLGVIVVKYIEIGLLTPPVGLNVYVVKGALGETVTLGQIFQGVAWFLVCEIVIMGLLIGFPQISLYLPNQAGI